MCDLRTEKDERRSEMRSLREEARRLDMQVQESGIVQSGGYAGQRYYIAESAREPGWWVCNLSDGNGKVAQRKIHERDLEAKCHPCT